MKCGCCGAPATKLAEYTAPDRPEIRRWLCDAPTCAPKDAVAWKFYPVDATRPS